ncbi:MULTISPECIES: hypothetical protein [unclassified Halorhabdus]|uniref:hypothetical protein n=1 Tax=unclassified Halorhabdus TaxID=2621901 RepID=UPI0023DC28C9|nr:MULTISPECIES: hypothetical protein [unclassified Halorhabdus]WEL17910.1 Uncharacterized protein SVXHr_1745 [Halorhabdus sp. SVX81]WEL21791.1 Uncharacterized protein HBNXHr_1732 [Halorhabdus sp. BNX81]
MSCKSQPSQPSEASFTTTQLSTDETAEDAVLTRTKRYTFYWQLGPNGPELLRVSDFDGTNVTASVDPPDDMYERLRQNSQRSA